MPGAGEPVIVRALTLLSDGVDPVPGNDSSTTVVALPTFVSITPTRVLDVVFDRAAHRGVAAGSTTRIPITALDEIPDGATSVVVNLTSTRIQDAGFLTLQRVHHDAARHVELELPARCRPRQPDDLDDRHRRRESARTRRLPPTW